ncbi:hypothetical protein [Okeania sp. SIO3I5]|nr:hypothetical protein [Okeania sp. SIO3I5]
MLIIDFVLKAIAPFNYQLSVRRKERSPQRANAIRPYIVFGG